MSVPSQQGEIPIDSANRNINMQPRMPTSNDVDKIVQTYFYKKGYNQAELAFIKDSSEHNLISLENLAKKFSKSSTPTDTTLPNYIKLIKDLENGAGDLDATQQSYESLREWTFNALDLYKDELRSILYPMFIFIFLDLLSKDLFEYGSSFFNKFKHDHLNHQSELDSLSCISKISDLEQNQTAQLYLNNKYSIRMSSIPFELFFQYLQESKFIVLLRVVNRHFNIHIITSKLSPASAGGSLASQKEGIIENNNSEFEKFHEVIPEANGVMKLVDEDEDEDMDKVKEEQLIDTMHMDEMSALPYRGTDIQAELDSLSELRKLVSLGNAALPSVCIYTFHNTHDRINCITISQDATLVAAGFSESFIKVWSLKGKKLQSKSEREEGLSGSDHKKLIGHSGPVYGTSFSHDNQYLISCSEDQTVRLWSLDTYKNLVCYKSHNYPIWDIDFGPYGFYFATASHDRTARLWSCDHVNPLRIFAGHLSDVNTVRFHPNSKYVVTASNDRTARLWDVQRGTCVRVFAGHTGAVHTVAISPNGRLMASGGEDQTIIVWDLGSGKKLKTMTGHTGFIYSVNFNAESTILVSGSADGTARVWDVNKDTLYETQSDVSDSKRMKYDKTSGKDAKEKREIEKTKASVSDAHKKKKGNTLESNDHLSVFPTKNTPIYTVQFTQRNLCLAAGAKIPPSLDL